MSAASLIRARMSGPSTALVRIRMRHEMESGQRVEGGAKVPAWHIERFTLLLGGRQVLAGDFGGGVSKDPFLEFTLRGVKPGDSLRLAWTDSRGATRSDDASILAAG